jgi:hypothetical protein
VVVGVGNLLYVARNGLQEIVKMTKTGTFISSFNTPISNDEGLECDVKTFAPDTVMWVKNAFRIMTTYEIEDGTCTCGWYRKSAFQDLAWGHFDFHGERDLVLLHSSYFEDGLGLEVHIRTQMRREFSYISSTALRIGADILEVGGKGLYFLNGVAGANI